MRFCSIIDDGLGIWDSDNGFDVDESPSSNFCMYMGASLTYGGDAVQIGIQHIATRHGRLTRIERFQIEVFGIDTVLRAQSSHKTLTTQNNITPRKELTRRFPAEPHTWSDSKSTPAIGFLHGGLRLVPEKNTWSLGGGGF